MSKCDLSRRQFLLGTGATAAAALLAACSKQGEDALRIESSEVPVGSAVVVGNYIVAQPESGVFHAYSARCPHQGAKVSIVEGDTVVCPSHGSVFSISDGAVLQGPARSALAEAKLSAEDSTLIVG